MRKMQNVVIRKYQEQKRLTETLMDKIALVSGTICSAFDTSLC